MELYENIQKLECLVLYQRDWHIGVVGIVAQRILDEFQKPTILLGKVDDEIKGSGRSVKGKHFVKALAHSSEHLLHFGGHEVACGLALKEEHLKGLKQALSDYFASQAETSPSILESIDGFLDPSQISNRLLDEFKLLKAFWPRKPRTKI